ncbi:MAG: 30S ribosome-binding factor RbfA [Alphaproteobacteria bacterium]|nr:30S ribosome-binding factor RbfA [Alphaproteobacteria bacterium]MBT7944359.1 30S ribosome-binding factor RbfA [Alphaproteobacteria bacterium]
MSKGEGKAPSQRQLRVGEELRHTLAWILERGEINDPGLAGAVVTVTEVRVSPDLRNATAFVMPLGGGHIDDVVEALNRAAPYMRHLMGKKIKLKRLPGLHFEADQTFAEAGRIDDLLKTPLVARDLQAEVARDLGADDDEQDAGDASDGA